MPMIVRRHAEHRRLTQPERERAREIKGFCTRHTREQGEGLERQGAWAALAIRFCSDTHGARSAGATGPDAPNAIARSRLTRTRRRRRVRVAGGTVPWQRSLQGGPGADFTRSQTPRNLAVISVAARQPTACAWLEVPYLGNDRCRGDLVPTLLQYCTVDPKSSHLAVISVSARQPTGYTENYTD